MAATEKLIPQVHESWELIAIIAAAPSAGATAVSVKLHRAKALSMK
jgi:hypothetical protein